MVPARAKNTRPESSPRPQRALWVLLLTCGLSVCINPSLPAEEFDRPLGALQVLEQAFRTNNPTTLRSLLKSESKIFISSPALGMSPSYYGRDQIFFIVRDRFRSNKTISFVLSGEKRLPERARELRTLGRWRYRDSRGRETWAEIEFSLARRDKAWYLREIRQKR